MNSLGKAIYRYYNKPSYNISSYPKSVETLRLGSPNKSKTDSVVPAASSSPPLEPEARHPQQEDANIIDPNKGVDQSIHLPPSPAQPLLLLVNSQEPTNANQTIANSDSPEPEALQEDPKVNNDGDILEKEYSNTAKKPKKFKDTRLVAITQENVGAGKLGSPELGTKSDTTASSLIEADREDDQIPVVTLPVTPQVMDDITSNPTSDTRLQGTKRSYSEVASSTSLD